MFTRPDQLQRKGGPEERFSFLQKLKDEYTTTKLLDPKQQILANLANFAYDPINYNFIKQLQIVDLFLDQLQRQESHELCAYAVGGLCNLSNDPEIATYITTTTTINSLLNLLHHTNQEIVLNSLTTLYYLARNEPAGNLIRTPVILNQLVSFRDSRLSTLAAGAQNNPNDDPRLTNLVCVFLHDIWDTKQSESVEVSSHSARDCYDIPLPSGDTAHNTQ